MYGYLNKNIQENINKQFLMETQKTRREIFAKFAESQQHFLANKLNLFTIAGFRGKFEQMRDLGDAYDMQMTMEGTTLI